MSFGDEAQNTWDKIRGKSTDSEEALNDQLDDQSSMEMQETLASDDGSEMEMPAASPEGFREHIGQDDAALSGDMGATTELPADDLATEDMADVDSDRDYDTDMEETSDEAFTDRDSF